MPELPEVETVARELQQSILNRQIRNIEAYWAKTYDNRTDTDPDGQRIHKIRRLGKYLIFELDKTYLVIHLRMTGQLIFSEHPNHDGENGIRALLTFYDGSFLYFKDMRKFGRIYHVHNPGEVMINVGIDALDAALTEEMFSGILKKKKTNVKSFLLDQNYIAGLGNIYIDESLFRAGVHPESVTHALKDKEVNRLYTSIRFILQSAVDNMGSTISDYRDAYGNEGNNQHYFNVYGRGGLTCNSCKTEISKMRLAGRGTHFCSNCQIIFK